MNSLNKAMKNLKENKTLDESFNHINDVWDYLEQSKNEDDLEERIGNIPSKFGTFTYDLINDGRSARVTNTWEDDDNWNDSETIDIDFIEESKTIVESKFDKCQATLPLDNFHSMGIIVSDNGETVQYMYSNDEDSVYESNIEYNEEGKPYFKDEEGQEWFIDEFMRTNYGENKEIKTESIAQNGNCIFALKIDCTSEAFGGINEDGEGDLEAIESEVARILNETAKKIANGDYSNNSNILDINGNVVGKYGFGYEGVQDPFMESKNVEENVETEDWQMINKNESTTDLNEEVINEDEEKERYSEYLSTPIKVYDIDAFVKSECGEDYQAFDYNSGAAIIYNESTGAGVMVDYEAVGRTFKTLDEEFELYFNTKAEPNTIPLMANRRGVTSTKEIIEKAPSTNSTIKDFFNKRNYNSRCSENFTEMMNYLLKVNALPEKKEEFLDPNITISPSTSLDLGDGSGLAALGALL